MLVEELHCHMDRPRPKHLRNLKIKGILEFKGFNDLPEHAKHTGVGFQTRMLPVLNLMLTLAQSGLPFLCNLPTP